MKQPTGIPEPAAFAGLRAPRLKRRHRALDDSILVGRHLLTAIALPLFKQRQEQAMDASAIQIPFEGLERSLVHDRLERVETSPRTVDVPRLRLDEVSPSQVQALLQHTPVIFEGLARECGMLDKWGLETLAREHRDADFWVTNADLTEFKGSLGDLLDEMMSGEETGRYVRGAADIFLKRPELERTLPVEMMAEVLGDLGTFFGAELFMGGPGTGSPFHCAPFFNFFTLVHGEKDWQFVHPSYTPWMYAQLHHTGFGISSLDHRAEPEVIAERWPLYGRITKMRARLVAGDMLINPPWWWHSVDNRSPSSIGIATRWAEPGLTRFNRRLELTSLLTKSAREVHREARRASRGARLTDAIWRERFNVKPPERLMSMFLRR